MNNRMAITTDGRITRCTAPEDKIGMGRCNHVSHQEPGESVEDFIKRSDAGMRYSNPEIKNPEEFRNHITKSVKDSVSSEVRRVLISQYNKGDNSLNIHVFCDYIDGSENLKYHDPNSSISEQKRAVPFIKRTKAMRKSIESKIGEYHKFDILTVDIMANESKNEDTLSKFDNLIGIYENKDTIL